MGKPTLSVLAAWAAAIVLTPVVTSPGPAFAQAYGDISFDSFHDELARYGTWYYSDRWGLVWQPDDVSDDFRPYDTAGHWAYTDDYGWMWVSDYRWGDIAFHYGRWVNDIDDGWLWIPGFTWSPAWVVWRSNPRYVGWMPMPPDEAFLHGPGDVPVGSSISLSFSWGDSYYGYRRWYGADYDDRRFASNWMVIGIGDLGSHSYERTVVRDPVQVVNIIHQTQNITNLTVVNNYVVNKSVDVHVVERAHGAPIQAVSARSVMQRPAFIASVDAGRRLHSQAQAVVLHGSGHPNSAPPPPPQVLAHLSAKAPVHPGRPPVHLFTKATVADPKVMQHFKGQPRGTAAPPREAAPPPAAHPPMEADHRAPPREQHDVSMPPRARHEVPPHETGKPAFQDQRPEDRGERSGYRPAPEEHMAPPHADRISPPVRDERPMREEPPRHEDRPSAAPAFRPEPKPHEPPMHAAKPEHAPPPPHSQPQQHARPPEKAPEKEKPHEREPDH